MVIFRVDQEDHDGNLINFLNVCQKEGLILNSKKLELQRERVTFFSVEWCHQPWAFQEQTIIGREFISEVPVSSCCLCHMSPLKWPFLLSELVHYSEIGVSLCAVLEFLNLWLHKCVVYPYIQLDLQ